MKFSSNLAKSNKNLARERDLHSYNYLIPNPISNLNAVLITVIFHPCNVKFFKPSLTRHKLIFFVWAISFLFLDALHIWTSMGQNQTNKPLKILDSENDSNVMQVTMVRYTIV